MLHPRLAAENLEVLITAPLLTLLGFVIFFLALCPGMIFLLGNWLLWRGFEWFGMGFLNVFDHDDGSFLITMNWPWAAGSTMAMPKLAHAQMRWRSGSRLTYSGLL